MIERGGGGGVFVKWLGPFIVNGLSKNGLVTLMNVNSGKVSNKGIIRYFSNLTSINADDTFDKDKESITEVDEEEPSIYILILKNMFPRLPIIGICYPIRLLIKYFCML